MRRFKELLLGVGHHIFGTRRARGIVVSLAAVVVFATTYMLILPAFTLEKEEAEKQGGISLATEAPAYNAGDLTFEGKGYDLEAYYKKSAKIPEDTKLKVTEIDKTSKEYQDYRDKALKAVQKDAGTNKVSDLSFAKFYDISLLSGGSEIEPADTVNVTLSFDKGIEADKAEHVRVLHFKEDSDSGKVKAEILQSDDIDVTITKGKMTEAAFDADSFSVYAVVYTVDFEYVDEESGEVYSYSLDGGKSVRLSDLFKSVGIKKDINDVAKAVFSDESLLTVKENQEDHDWTLKSLKPFTSKEKLTISMKDGQEIIINVTDDQPGVWDLANTDNTQFLHVSAESSVTQNEQERDAAFKLTFTYSLEQAVVEAIDDYDQPFDLVYDLNSLIDNSPIGSIRNNLNGVIQIGSRKLGTYKVENGVVTLHFTDISYFDDRTTFTGFFNLTAETSETELGTNDEYTYSFPGTGDTIPIHYKKTVEEGSKGYNLQKDSDGNYTLHYTANVNVNSNLDSMVFNDTFSGLQTLDASSVKINGTPVSVSPSGNGFSFDVAAALGTQGVAKGSYQVTYDMKVKAEQLEAMEADQTTEKNTANWTVNGDREVPGGSTTVNIDKPVPPIPVEKTITNGSGTSQPGDTVTYTVTYGDENTALAGFNFSDQMTDVVIPQGQVTINYNGQTRSIEFGSQAKDSSYSKGNVTLYEYTFPEGTPGTGPVTVTYSVKLLDAQTAKDNGIYDTTVVTNTAQEHRQNTTDTENTTVEYEKEPVYSVDKTASANPVSEDGKWLPGSVISYTLTVGDANTNMAGVNIKDVMTDLQTLQGDVMIQVGNGSPMKLNDYVSGAVTWTDDGSYSANNVELFNFNMPSSAGNGPVVITYTTNVISQNQATAAGIYGDVSIRNVGSGGKQSDGTDGTGVFESFPIEKAVTQAGANVNGSTVEMGSTIHYTLTFGKAGMNLAGTVIEDYMTDLQKLVGNITINKADGSSFTMPAGTGQWSEDGNNWDFWDDGKYSESNICLFKYRLPNDIGEGPITVEYDAQIISEAEAKESGLNGSKWAHNQFKVGNHTAETQVQIDFPTEVTHNPKVTKEFNNKWDVDNNTLFWDIIVEKDDQSAYPLENVSVREFWDHSGIVIKNESIGVYHETVTSAENFDLINAVVTTDDGTQLTPGVDYTIDKAAGKFTFPVLNERVHISLPFHSPVQISNGFTMHNVVQLNTYQTAEADATYTNPNVEIVKKGLYSENSHIIAWEVQLNPSKKAYEDGEPLRLDFTDHIPDGLTVLNMETLAADNPSVYVQYSGSLTENKYVPVTVSESGVLTADLIFSREVYDHWTPEGDVYRTEYYGGLNQNKITIKYFTKLSDAEWDAITSSASGAESFKNDVTVTAGDGDTFETSDTVNVTSDGYLTKTDTTSEPGGIVIDPDTGENSKNITYKVAINPNGYALNNGSALSLTDYISTNMDLDTGSVKVVNGAGADVTESLAISYNDDSRLLSIRNIPDRTPYVLTYTCIARAQGEDTFKNTATLIGGGSHSASTTEKHTIQTNDAGVSVDGIFMNLHKIDENHISDNLKGAKFQLFECELEIGDLTNPDSYTQEWWTNLLAMVDRRTAGNATQEEINYIDANFKIKKYTLVGTPVVTGATGFTQWDGLSEKKLYAWIETEAPEGYTGYAIDDYHYFVGYQHMNVNIEDPSQTQPLPADEQLRRKQAAWALDDAAQFANGIRVASMANLTTWTATNVESKYTSISASKEWENDSDNLFDTRPKDGIKLQLVRINADGTRENVGSPVAINVGEDGETWPSYIWNQLPSRDAAGNVLKYTVVESPVENYSTTYSDEGNGQTSGAITVTNRMIPKSTDIHIKKNFGDGTEMPDHIFADLKVIRTNRDGVAGEPEDTDYRARLDANNNWSYTFEKLPTTDNQGNTLSYTVREDLAELETQGKQYVVTYSDDGKGVIETTAESPLTITNSKITGKVIVTKTFEGIAEGQIPENFRITAAWTNEGGNVETADLTVTGDQPDGVTREGSGLSYTWTITNLPLGAEVTFTESGYDIAGYTVTTTPEEDAEGNVSQTAIAALMPATTADFVNSYTLTKDFEFTKVWKNQEQQTDGEWQQDIKIALYSQKGKVADFTLGENGGSTGEYTWTAVKNADGTYTFKISDLPPMDGQDELTYYVQEEQVTGYGAPIYAKKQGEDIVPKTSSEEEQNDRAFDGEYIINAPEDAYELPSTGSTGTTLIYILGAIMTLGAGALLLLKRRRALQ